jgi:uncharacterized membrane-anchored protein
MKKILACMAIMLTALLFSFSDIVTVTAQKKETKSEKEPAIELKNLSPEQQELLKQMKEREEIASKLKFQQGQVKLKDGLATLKVPANFRYLDPDQTDTVLVQLWHNPPRQEKTLGMLFPGESKDSIMESWGVVITYNEDGYVEDDESASINYNDLLKEMKEGTRESNQERTKMGYERVELIG